MIRKQDASKANTTGKVLSKGFILLLCTSLLVKMGMQVQDTVMPLYTQDVLGGTTGTVGTLMTVYMVAALVSRLYLGTIVDKHGSKPTILIGIAMYMVTGILFTFMHSLSLMYLVVTLQGIGLAATTIAYSSALAELVAPEHLSQALGYYYVTQSICSGLCPPVIIFLLGMYGYSTYLYVLFIALMGLGFIITSLKRTKYTPACSIEKGGAVLSVGTPTKTIPAADGRAEGPPVGDAAHSNIGAAAPLPPHKQRNPSALVRFFSRFIEKGALLPSLVICLYGFASIMISTFLSTYGLSLGIEGIGLYFTVQTISYTLGSLLIGAFNRKFGYKRVTLVFSILQIGAFFCFSLVRSLLGFTAIAAVYGFSDSLFFTNLNTFALRLAPSDRQGAAGSTFFSFYDLGNAVGSSLWGVVSNAVGLGNTFAISTVGFIAMLALYLTSLHGKIRNMHG